MLSRLFRITQTTEFRSLLQKGRYLSSDVLILRWRPSPRPLPRFGFLVSKKVSSKTTRRNLLKRRLRRVIYKYLEKVRGQADYLFIAKPRILTKNYSDLEQEMVGLLKRSGQLTFQSLSK